MYRYLLFTLILLLNSCFQEILTRQTMLEVQSIAKLDEEQKVKPGGLILEKKITYFVKAIKLQKNIEAGDGYWKPAYFVPAQTMELTAEDDKFEYYKAKGMYAQSMGKKQMLKTGALRLSKNRPDEVVLLKDLSVIAPKALSEASRDDFELIQVKDPKRESLLFSLSYEGKKGDKYGFIYKQQTLGVKKDLKSKIYQLDLSKATVLEVNGARVELKAAEQNVSYRILEDFAYLETEKMTKKLAV